MKQLAEKLLNIRFLLALMIFTGTLATVAVAMLTVSFQSVKAALMDPVKSLRSE